MVFGNRCGGSGSYIIIIAQLPVTTEFFFSHIIFAFFPPPLVNQKTKDVDHHVNNARFSPRG